jgi:hypothetical protein
MIDLASLEHKSSSQMIENWKCMGEMMKKQARLGRREKIENSSVQRDSTYDSGIGDGEN